MAIKGWKVYAGCLTDQGIQNLKEKVPSILALKLDVTKDADIAAVVKRISSESPQGLYCLVNNAGIGKVSKLVHTPSVRSKEQADTTTTLSIYISSLSFNSFQGGIIDWMPMQEFRAIMEVGR